MERLLCSVLAFLVSLVLVQHVEGYCGKFPPVLLPNILIYYQREHRRKCRCVRGYRIRSRIAHEKLQYPPVSATIFSCIIFISYSIIPRNKCGLLYLYFYSFAL